MVTLPTTFVPGHSPTAAECAQVLSAFKEYTNLVYEDQFGLGSVSLASSTWTDVTGVIGSLTKYGDGSGGSTGSDLVVFMAGSWYIPASAPTSAQFGISVNGSVTAICRFNCNDLNVHHTMGGAVVLTGLAAGSYTLKGKIQRFGGTGTVTVDFRDFFNWFAFEVPH